MTATKTNKTILQAIHAKALTTADGYWARAVADKTQLVSVSVGRAAQNRGHAGKIVIDAEWYVQESYSDDDNSIGGFKLPSKIGLARRTARLVVDSVNADNVAAFLRDNHSEWVMSLIAA